MGVYCQFQPVQPTNIVTEVYVQRIKLNACKLIYFQSILNGGKRGINDISKPSCTQQLKVSYNRSVKMSGKLLHIAVQRGGQASFEARMGN